MLTLFCGLHCTLQSFHFNFVSVLLAYLHVFNTWYYRISSSNTWWSYFKINLGQKAKLRRNWKEIQRGKILVYQIILVYINDQYIKTAHKITVRRMFFFYFNGKLDLMLKRRDGGAITKFKKSVGWTIGKFRLNNSRVINGTILRFSYRIIDV